MVDRWLLRGIFFRHAASIRNSIAVAIFMKIRSKTARKSVASLRFDRNRLPNQSWERFGLDFLIVGVLLAARGGLRATIGAPLGDFGGPWGYLGGALGLPGDSLDTLWDALGTLLGPCWAPRGGREGFPLRNHQN